MTPHDPVDHEGTWRQTAAAVTYLAEASGRDFSVWDALTESVSAWLQGTADDDAEPVATDLPFTDPDPLRSALASPPFTHLVYISSEE